MRRVVLAAIFLTPTILVVVSSFALLTLPDIQSTSCTSTSSNSGWLMALFVGALLSIGAGIIASEELR